MTRQASRGVARAASASLLSLGLTAALLPLAAPAQAAASSPSSTCAKAVKPTKAQLASTTGITAKEVKVANISILTGIVPGLFKGAQVGAEAYLRYLNAHGGVNGRKVTLEKFDDGFSGQRNQQLTQQALAKDFALVGSMSIFDNFGCKVLATNGAMPDVSVTLDPATNSLPNIFSPMPLNQAASLGPYQRIKREHPKAVRAVGNLVVDSASPKALWVGQKTAMTHVGYKVVYERYINPLETNFTPDVVNMKRKGVQLAYLTEGNWQIEAAIVNAMAAQHFRPQVLYSEGPVYAKQFVAAVGPTKAQGLILSQGMALYLGEDAKIIPAVKTFNDWVKRTDPKFTPDLYTLFGWTSAQLFANALAKAGKHPTRGSVLAALAKVNRFDASGLLAPTNPAKKISSNCYLMAKLDRGRWVRTSPKGKGWNCEAPQYGVHGYLPKVK